MEKPVEWLSGCEGRTYWFTQQCALCYVLATRDRDHHHTPVPAIRGSRCCADVRKADNLSFCVPTAVLQAQGGCWGM